MVLFPVLLDGAVGTGEDAGPAADAFFFVNGNNAGFRVFGERNGEAGIDAGRLGAVMAAHGKGYRLLFFDADAGKRLRRFAVVGFNEVARL